MDSRNGSATVAARSRRADCESLTPMPSIRDDSQMGFRTLVSRVGNSCAKSLPVASWLSPRRGGSSIARHRHEVRCRVRVAKEKRSGGTPQSPTNDTDLWRPCRDASLFRTTPGIALRDDAGLLKCDPFRIVSARLTIKQSARIFQLPTLALGCKCKKPLHRRGCVRMIKRRPLRNPFRVRIVSTEPWVGARRPPKRRGPTRTNPRLLNRIPLGFIQGGSPPS